MDDRPAIKFDAWPFSEDNFLVIKDQGEATGTLLDRHRIALSEVIDGDVHSVPDTPAHMRRRIRKPDREKCSLGLTITYTKAKKREAARLLRRSQVPERLRSATPRVAQFTGEVRNSTSSSPQRSSLRVSLSHGIFTSRNAWLRIIRSRDQDSCSACYGLRVWFWLSQPPR
jgi:hypothetical protein